MNALKFIVVIIMIIGIGLFTNWALGGNDDNVEPKYVWQQQPDALKEVYTYTDLANPEDLYCGYFSTQSVIPPDSTQDSNTTVYTCGCEPVEIENGTFDSTKCDYTCAPGYETWFAANGQEYTTTSALKNNISLKNLNAKKPNDEPYCIPLTGTLKPCGTAFDNKKYKNAFQVYSNEEWSTECYASTKEDCQDGYNFQKNSDTFGTCNKHLAMCNPAQYYDSGDPCFPSKCEKQEGCKARDVGTCQYKCAY